MRKYSIRASPASTNSASPDAYGGLWGDGGWRGDKQTQKDTNRIWAGTGVCHKVHGIGGVAGIWERGGRGVQNEGEGWGLEASKVCVGRRRVIAGVEEGSWIGREGRLVGWFVRIASVSVNRRNVCVDVEIYRVSCTFRFIHPAPMPTSLH